MRSSNGAQSGWDLLWDLLTGLLGRKQPCPASSSLGPPPARGGGRVPHMPWWKSPAPLGRTAGHPAPRATFPSRLKIIQIWMCPPTATDWGPPCPRELALKRRGKVGEGGETCRGRWGTGILLGLGTRKTARKCWESYRCAERNLSKRSVKIKHRKNSSQLAMLGISILFPLWKITLVNPCHINGQKPKMQGRYYKSGSAVNPWQ